MSERGIRLTTEREPILLAGDCLEQMHRIPDDCLDAVVTDPPYEINFMGKSWDKAGVAFDTNVWTEVLRVLKPGGHLLCFGATRTFHRIAVAIEDAGFELRDTIMYCYGSGFPKGQNLGKQIDKRLDREHKAVGHTVDEAGEWEGWNSQLKPFYEPCLMLRKPFKGSLAQNVLEHGVGGINIDGCRVGTTKSVPGGLSRGRGGGGEALSGNADGSLRNETGNESGHDSNVGRYPANFMLQHHDACEDTGSTATVKGDQRAGSAIRGIRNSGFGDVGSESGDSAPNGAVYGNEVVPVWSCHPDCPVKLLNQASGTLTSGKVKPEDFVGKYRAEVYGAYAENRIDPNTVYSDSGGASRFVYVSKASKKERNAGLPEGMVNKHPTVKSLKGMQHLVRMVTPPGGVVLDPFMGSGTTGCACVLEGFNFIGIDLDPEFVEIARHRIAHYATQKAISA